MAKSEMTVDVPEFEGFHGMETYGSEDHEPSCWTKA
jgi:hypothetical protein